MSNDGYIMPYAHAVQSLRYWRDLAECDCDSELPTGGCEKCDMQGILNLLRQMRTQLDLAHRLCINAREFGDEIELEELEEALDA